MSLVQAIITEDFLLVGADKRAVRHDGTTTENNNKLIKLNSNIIFGCTGGAMDNFKLFNGYCYYSDTIGFVNSDEQFDISYNDFADIISNRFQTMYNEHIDKNHNGHYEICSLVCGYNGNEFEVSLFTMGSTESIPDGIMKVTKSKTFPYKGVNAGKIVHIDKLQKLVEQSYFKYGNLTMRQYKNILLDVFESGSKIDKTINNCVCFEKIKRKDVMNVQ